MTGRHFCHNEIDTEISAAAKNAPKSNFIISRTEVLPSPVESQESEAQHLRGEPERMLGCPTRRSLGKVVPDVSTTTCSPVCSVRENPT